jgi:hypothetical protein
MYDCARKYAERYPDNDILGLKYALSMLRTKRYADCTEFLSKLHVLPNEGASEGRQVYHEAWLNLAKQSINAKDYAKALTQIETARQYPEQLGVGKPYDADIDMRVEDYLSAWCYDKMNDKQNAATYHARVKQANEKFGDKKMNFPDCFTSFYNSKKNP